jgi:flagellin
MTPAASRLTGTDLLALNNLSRAYSRVNESSLRLATLHRINRGSDDPAGLVAAETIQAELAAIEAADRGAARAAANIEVADSALSVVGDLIADVRGNILAASGENLSDAEQAAHQLEIDAALEAIDRIGSTTQFNGRNLLDGSTVQFFVGPQAGDVASVTLPSVSTASLGDAGGSLADLRSGGSASLESGNHARAAEILDAASSRVLQDRARLGAFSKYTLDSSRQVLGAAAVNLSSALSQIRDTDFAVESARLVQSRILAQSSLAAVGLGGRRALAASLLLS